jgi:hypothetical protein
MRGVSPIFRCDQIMDACPSARAEGEVGSDEDAPGLRPNVREVHVKPGAKAKCSQ